MRIIKCDWCYKETEDLTEFLVWDLCNFCKKEIFHCIDQKMIQIRLNTKEN